jgi:tetratricopeptide (TPR) repeat protein
LALGSSTRVAFGFLYARRYDEAIEASQKIFELSKLWSYLLLGYTYAGKGMFKEAIASYQESIREGNSSPSVQIYLGAAYAQAGEPEKVQAILKKLETSKEYVSPGELGILYGALGNKEAAFKSLEKGFAEHDLQLQYLKSDPAFDPLRDDPRFQDLMRRVGLPQ